MVGLYSVNIKNMFPLDVGVLKKGWIEKELIERRETIWE